jgi:hypothetical protein
MNEELRQKLIKDLDKSGFASEMRVLKIFHSRNWNAQSGQGYFDKDESITREIDISAYSSVWLKHGEKAYASIFFHIIAEIKKTEQPWIVFQHRLEHRWKGCAWNNIIFSVNLPDEPYELADYITKTSLIQVRGWLGSGIHQAFKDPAMPSRWYQAFTSVCKACEDTYELEQGSGWRSSSDVVTSNVLENMTEFSFFQPLVILDGILVAAKLSDSGEIQLEEVSSVPFQFEFRTKNYHCSHYRVDLVTVDGLEEYLTLAKQRQRDIADGLQELASSHLEEDL